MRTCIRQRHTRSGLTLIEVVTSLSIMTVLMLGLSGAIMISSHAIPTATDTGLADQAVIDTINQLRSELHEANTVRYSTGGTGSIIVIKIKDAGAAGTPSKITYTYTSSTGTLTRKVGLLSDVTLITGIDGYAVEITDDGIDASVVRLLIAVKDTIQRFYEMHAVLPNKPEKF